MKEIGEKFKSTREGIGVHIEEVSEDLKVRPSQIEDVENGDINAFKDVFLLKKFIQDYSKYLGLNYEDVVDEFNEYLFDYTSQISLEDIKKAKNNEDSVKSTKRIISPYTMEQEKKKSIIPRIIIVIIVILLIVGGVFFYKTSIENNNNRNENNIIG